MSKHKRAIKRNTSRQAAGITGFCTNCDEKAQTSMIFAEPGAEVDGKEKTFMYCWMHGYAFVAEELSQTRKRMQKRDAIILHLHKQLELNDPKLGGAEEE